MKLTLLFAFSCSFFSAFSQSFTQLNEPQIGENLTLYVCDETFSNHDSDNGDGVTWDFSSITADASQTTKALSVESNSNISYTTSSMSTSIPSFLDTYWSSDVNGKSSQGFVYYTNDNSIGDFEVVFDSDEEKVMDYPSTLGASLTDNFTGTFTNAQYASGGSPCTGSITSEIDARGTLILPGNNTYTNVLRHKVTETTNTSIIIFGFSNAVTVTRVQYDYYDLSTSSLPLFSHIDISYNSAALSDQITLVLSSVAPGTPVSTASLSENKQLSLVKAFPNPVKNSFELKGDIVGSSELHIIDPNGREIMSYQDVNTGEVINVSDLLPGVYYVRVLNKGNSSIIKIIIE
ncbi:T9SS type A sorting domain-containing protein [Crocinitomicaceae bacterium]|nr:T9SS type A sorting domain-containing protein [Crocinitomicaceae bacterium]